MVQCPRCGQQVNDLINIDEAMAAKLQQTGESSPAVCASCHNDLRRSPAISSGGVLVAQEKAKEQHRLQLWKSRVGLIKKARSQMGRKMYSEAAASYEKYLRILEIVFGCKKGETLSPAKFKESARTGELTVVTSVYWDLLRIYDSSDKYLERQQTAAKQLAIFVQFTPIFPDIIKRAEVFVKSAKHPQVIKAFLKGAAQQRPRCFIATAAFQDVYSTEVQTLRWFRDYYLKKKGWGRLFVRQYYYYSPAVARWLDQHPIFKKPIRILLGLLVRALRGLAK